MTVHRPVRPVAHYQTVGIPRGLNAHETPAGYSNSGVLANSLPIGPAYVPGKTAKLCLTNKKISVHIAVKEIILYI
jgi:hypothetical protein